MTHLRYSGFNVRYYFTIIVRMTLETQVSILYDFSLIYCSRKTRASLFWSPGICDPVPKWCPVKNILDEVSSVKERNRGEKLRQKGWGISQHWYIFNVLPQSSGRPIFFRRINNLVPDQEFESPDHFFI